MPEPRPGSLEKRGAERRADDAFLALLRRFTDQGRNVSDKKCPTYAPTMFANDPVAKAEGISKKDFVEAMERLFADGRIRVHTEGPPSHPRSRLVETSNTPSNAFQLLPTGGGVSPP